MNFAVCGTCYKFQFQDALYNCSYQLKIGLGIRVTWMLNLFFHSCWAVWTEELWSLKENVGIDQGKENIMLLSCFMGGLNIFWDHF